LDWGIRDLIFKNLNDLKPLFAFYIYKVDKKYLKIREVNQVNILLFGSMFQVINDYPWLCTGLLKNFV